MAKPKITKSQLLQYREWGRAKKLRRNPTAEESRVWLELSQINYQLPEGCVWRRQCCIGRYIVDFLCEKAKLGLEVDGSSHNGKEAYDLRRQRFLERAGYEILHITNVDTYDAEQLQRYVKALHLKTLHRLGNK